MSDDGELVVGEPLQPASVDQGQRGRLHGVVDDVLPRRERDLGVLLELRAVAVVLGLQPGAQSLASPGRGSGIAPSSMPWRARASQPFTYSRHQERSAGVSVRTIRRW